MAKEFCSRIFGKTRFANKEELDAIEIAVDATPVAVLNGLNRKLNARGMCISISQLATGAKVDAGRRG